MALTDTEIAEHLKVLEDLFWSRRRPPLHLRDKVREGRIGGRWTVVSRQLPSVSEIPEH